MEVVPSHAREINFLVAYREGFETSHDSISKSASAQAKQSLFTMKLSRILFIGIVSVAAITVPTAFATRSLRQESTSASIDSEDAGVASADSLDSIDSIDAPISLIRPVEPFEPPRLGVVPLDTHHQTDSTNTFATHGDIVRQHSRELVHAFVKLRGLDPEDEMATPTVEAVSATAPPEDFKSELVKQHPIEPSHFGSRRHFKG